MNIVGIIAEYNPMHNGHVYHIKKAKELTNADYVVVIMSGSFTEQGNISVINKMDRAKLCIQNGADMVIELPTIYAVSSAENFAFGAVNILNSLGCITHLAFGSEADNILELENVSKIYLEHEKQIINKSKEYIKLGINSAKAYAKAFNEFLQTNIDITLPNNILALEYLKALMRLKSKIKPVLVHRQSSSHSDDKLDDVSVYASSTSIRNVLSDTSLKLKDKLTKIQKVVPKSTYNYLENNNFNTNENIWQNLRYEIIKLGIDNLKNIYEVNEGLETKLYNCALKSNSYTEFIFNCKSKRYTLSRIKRIAIYILLGITKDLTNNLTNVKYARILKVNENSSKLLSLITKNSKIPVITKVTDKILNELETSVGNSLRLDILAANISNTNVSNLDYTNNIK